MLRRYIGIALAALVAPLAVFGCGTGGNDRSLTIGAAASLRTVLPPLAPGARIAFAGSDQLAAQIQEGAPIDVFVSADRKYTDALYSSRLVEPPVAIASNALTIVVPIANPARIASPKDIATPGVRLVLAQESVPVGAYARRALRSLDLDAALDNVVSNEDAVTGVVAKVRLGEADAGIVYETDAVAASAEVRTIAIPAAAQPTIIYTAAVVTASQRRSAADAFVATLAGADGQEALRAAGFPPAPGVAEGAG